MEPSSHRGGTNGEGEEPAFRGRPLQPVRGPQPYAVQPHPYPYYEGVQAPNPLYFAPSTSNVAMANFNLLSDAITRYNTAVSLLEQKAHRNFESLFGVISAARLSVSQTVRQNVLLEGYCTELCR
mmetsp:Transcript_29780/g.76898  ORF Transcript_29780/g.76898 Transcript_29780/m.76898 type:complete len:125 (+) Transcript_29780:478-852(+)